MADNIASSVSNSETDTHCTISSAHRLHGGNGMVYIDTSGQVIFSTDENSVNYTAGAIPVILDTADFSGSQCLDQNYLVVVDHNGEQQTVTHDLDGASVLINSSNIGSGVAPHSSILNTGKEDTKLTEDQTHQQTVMVLDSHQFSSDRLLVDPNAFVASYSSVEPDIEIGSSSLQDSYINLPGTLPIAEDPGSLTSKNDETVPRSDNYQLCDVGHTRLPSLVNNDLFLHENGVKITPTSSGQEEQKESHRYSKASHYQFENEVKESNETNSQCFSASLSRRELPFESLSSKPDDEKMHTNGDVHDILIFSSITAKINTDIFVHVPGCQSFLLNKMRNIPTSSSIELTFTSEEDCTFCGTLESFIQLHNELKMLSGSKEASILEMKPAQTIRYTDQSVMCTLLQPFVSSRGRQPKYSFKAKALEYTSDFESLLKIDRHLMDEDYKSGTRKRKQRKPKKLSGLGKNMDITQNVSVLKQSDIDESRLHTDSDIVSENASTSNIEMIEEESEDKKQSRLSEEMLVYKYFCQRCSFKSKTHRQFLSHLRCHKSETTENMHSCKTCDFVTSKLSNLKRHETKHKENLFSCKECQTYKTNKIQLLEKHMQLKHNPNALKCKQCGYEASSSKDLFQHKLQHDRHKAPYICPQCNRVLRSKNHLRRHVRDVHGPDVRPHLCDICGKGFKRTDSLQQHKILHAGPVARERILRFTCTTCGKAMRSMAHLKEHMAIHTLDRPYLCQHCGAAFKTQGAQKRHMVTLHIRPRLHVCSLCCKQFNTTHALKRHTNTHKKNPVVFTMELDKTDNMNVEKEKLDVISNFETQSASLTISVANNMETQQGTGFGVDNEESCLVNTVMDSTCDVQETDLVDDMDTENMQQAYTQGTQDGTTLYYFTGDLNSL